MILSQNNLNSCQFLHQSNTFIKFYFRDILSIDINHRKIDTLTLRYKIVSGISPIKFTVYWVALKNIGSKFEKNLTISRLWEDVSFKIHLIQNLQKYVFSISIFYR